MFSGPGVLPTFAALKQKGTSKHRTDMNRTSILLLSLLLTTGRGLAQEGTLSLDSCRSLAIRNNKELRMADMRVPD